SQLQEPTQVEQRSSNQQIQKTTTQKKVSPKDQTACQKYRAMEKMWQTESEKLAGWEENLGFTFCVC
ncbi:hypothetical protein, partial [Helicobacter bizzozeronii]|uniref:hypothetical protein n=1 Tax=Helicobacter bizzozeronii TaxID=56877 RepID=UPI001B31CDC1